MSAISLRLTPSRGERSGVGVRAARLPEKFQRRTTSRTTSSNLSAFTPNPNPSPFEGEGRGYENGVPIFTGTPHLTPAEAGVDMFSA